jgi:hypothetical protein
VKVLSLEIRTITATRYVTPLREGGSLPAIVEASDDGLYVLKFRGAGQGPKALIAELIVGEIGRALGLPVPEIVFVELDAALAGTEPDPEIQDLLKASSGLNLALDYLPGSVMYDPVVEKITPELASSVVWFDAYATNVDRTPRNANMLIWHKRLWLIDHGAALYFHHSWNDYMAQSQRAFTHIKDHILLSSATQLREVDALLSERLTPALIEEVVSLVPDIWLETAAPFDSTQAHKKAYADYLQRRLEAPRLFVEEAERVRTASRV